MGTALMAADEVADIRPLPSVIVDICVLFVRVGNKEHCNHQGRTPPLYSYAVATLFLLVDFASSSSVST